LKIVVRCQSAGQFQSFLGRNSWVDNLDALFSIEPSSAAVDAIVAIQQTEAAGPLFVVVDSDIVLPIDFVERLQSVVANVRTRNPNWAVVSASGYSPVGIGASGDQILDFDFWSRSPDVSSDHIIPISNFDAGLLVFNLEVISKLGLTDEVFSEPASLLKLAFEFAKAGLPMFATGALAARRTKRIRPQTRASKVLAKVENEWFANRTRATRIEMVGQSVIVRPESNVDPLKNGFDLELETIKNARIQGLAPRLIIVTDATDANPLDLKRLRLSIAALAARCDRLAIEHNIIGQAHHLGIGTKLVKTTFLPTEIETLDDSLGLMNLDNAMGSTFWLEAAPSQWVFPQAAPWLLNAMLSYQTISTFKFGGVEINGLVQPVLANATQPPSESGLHQPAQICVLLDTQLISAPLGSAHRTDKPSMETSTPSLAKSAIKLFGLDPRNLVRQVSRITSITEIRYLLNRILTRAKR